MSEPIQITNLNNTHLRASTPFGTLTIPTPFPSPASFRVTLSEPLRLGSGSSPLVEELDFPLPLPGSLPSVEGVELAFSPPSLSLSSHSPPLRLQIESRNATEGAVGQWGWKDLSVSGELLQGYGVARQSESALLWVGEVDPQGNRHGRAIEIIQPDLPAQENNTAQLVSWRFATWEHGARHGVALAGQGSEANWEYWKGGQVVQREQIEDVQEKEKQLDFAQFVNTIEPKFNNIINEILEMREQNIKTLVEWAQEIEAQAKPKIEEYNLQVDEYNQKNKIISDTLKNILACLEEENKRLEDDKNTKSIELKSLKEALVNTIIPKLSGRTQKVEEVGKDLLATLNLWVDEIENNLSLITQICDAHDAYSNKEKDRKILT